MLNAILILIKELPKLIAIYDWIKNEIKEDPAVYLKKLQDLRNGIKEMKTDKEKVDVAKKMQDLIRRM